MPRIIGLDPGLLGGASLFQDGEFLCIHRTPVIKGKGKSQYNLPGMLELLESFQPIKRAYLEKAGAFPGQGATSGFRFGMGFGIWLGLLGGLRIPFELVSPQRWQKGVLVDVPGKDPKLRGRLFISQAFPELKIQKDLIDAFLIGLWGSRQEYTKIRKARNANSPER